jgi:cysteine desulfurase/selenocysteine lyase
MTSTQALTLDLADEFPLEERLIYLNHAALSPWPRRTANAIHQFTDENLYRGPSNYGLWLEAESRLRQRITRLINAPLLDDIALQKNTSEALSAIAMGLSWQSGENVVLPQEEFPSNRLPWESLQTRGVEVRLQVTEHGAHPEQALMNACDERTRLMAISSVSFSSGIRFDLANLGRFCREHDIIFCVDAIQSLGALPIDVQGQQIDFLACGAHKWLMAPEGIGFLYVGAALRSRLTLHQHGWRMLEKPLSFDQVNASTSRSARRFECGTLNTMGIIGLDASLSLIQELGTQAIADRVMDNSRFLVSGLQQITGIKLVTPAASNRHAGIVSLQANNPQSTRTIYAALKHANVLAAMRSGCLRLSPHFYTPRAHLEATLELIERSAASLSV